METEIKFKCKFRAYERSNDAIIRQDYSCDDIRANGEKMKKKFRDDNKSDFVEKDPAFDRYAKEIEDFLTNCPCIKIAGK